MTHTRRTLTIIGAATAVFLAVAWWGWSSISAKIQPEKIRQEVMAALTDVFPKEVVTVKVDSAKLELDHGLIVRGLTITPAGEEDSPVLHVERLVAKIDALALASKNPMPERIQLTGVDLQIHRQADGTWRHADLVASIIERVRARESSDAPAMFPNVFLDRGRLRYIDEAIDWGPLDVTLDSLEAHVTARPSTRATSTPDVVISLQGQNPLFDSLAAHIRWQSHDSSLLIDRVTARVDLSRRQEVALPATLAEKADRLKIGGVLTVDGSCEVNGAGKILNLVANCEVTRGALILQSGFHFKAVNGTIELRDDQIRLRHIRALTPAGSAEAKGHVHVDLSSISGDADLEKILRDLEFDFDLHSVTLGKELLPTIPEVLRKVIDDNRIEGRIKLHGNVSSSAWPPDPNDLTLEVDLLDVSAMPFAFPYPLRHGEGSVTLREMHVRTEQRVSATAGAGQLDVVLDLDLTDVPTTEGPSVRGELVITAEDISGDSTLRDALPESGIEIWDAFSPSGRGEARVHLIWTPGHERPRILLALEPHSGQMKFRHFPLPFHSLHGTMRFDLGHGEALVEIVEAAGKYRGNLIKGSGTYRRTDAGLSSAFKVQCDSMKLDRELVRLLPHHIQDPLREYRVSGSVAVDAEIVMNSDETWTGTYTLTLSPGNQIIVHPPGMAFPFILTGGTIHANDNGTVFKDVTCRDPAMVLAGKISRDGNMELAGNVAGLFLGERLLGLFPESVRGEMRELDLRGEADFDFFANVGAPEKEGDGRPYNLTLSNIHSREAGLDVGLRLRKIACRTGTLTGEGVLGKYHTFEGTFQVESSYLDRLRAEQATVRIAYGKPHAAVSASADGESFEDSGYVVTEDLRKNLLPGACGETLQVLVGPATLYGGSVRGFLFADFSDIGDLKGHFEVDNIDLGLASNQIFESRSVESTGTLAGHVDFSGLTGESTELLGSGSMRIENGALGKGPVLSRVLTEFESKSDEKIDFNKVRVEFTIQDEKFHAAKGGILIEGPRMSLVGRGTMDFNWVLDLTFIPKILANAEIFIAQFGEIRVIGPLDKPRHEVKVLPAVIK